MTAPGALRDGAMTGALAGLVGGVVSGMALARVGALPPTASFVRAESAAAGLILHVLMGVGLGAGFGLLVWRQRTGAGETLFWGLTYGGIWWWFLGPLTLMPLLLLGFIAWDVHSTQEAFPSLVAYLLYGALTGLTMSMLRGRRRGSLLQVDAWTRGGLAGVLASWVIGFNQISMGLGIAAGVGFALLYPRPLRGTGPGLIRGMVYGFVWWVAGALTVFPLLREGTLAWSVEDARSQVAMLSGLLLFGSLLAMIYQWFDGLVSFLFSDTVRGDDEEGVGTEGLRAVGRGALAGLVGGIIFTAATSRLGLLPAAAGLMGSKSALTGFLVQLLIAVAIGITYALLFRRQSFDVGSALGWGVSYGFLWWILGPLTLMPVLQGTTPNWTVEAAASAFASLIGLLAYGGGLGMAFHLLEARHNPWWIPLTEAEAARVARHKEQLLTSAPALWALVVTIALALPIVLGM